MKLKDKTAIVTGGGSGIGEAIAGIFARNGARVVIADYHEVEGQKAAAMLTAEGLVVHSVTTDVRNDGDIERLFAFTLDTYGTLDILVNNAGVMDAHTALANISNELWERVIGINVTGVFKMTRTALPVFIRNGAGIIVNIASAAGLSGGQGGAAYTASKHAVIGLTKSVTDHYGHRGVRCNAIAPGGIKSNLRDSYGERDPEGFGRVSRFSAFKFEEGEPGEVAEIALFLASPESRLINGAVILADRGWNAY
jgi:NAD(P)-dependent dehydrogenase (short-subunit alcohol dehydrogenase family)